MIWLVDLGSIAQMLVLALALCLAFVGLSFLRIALKGVLFASADEESGLVVRVGGGKRMRIPWSAVLKLVRARPSKDSPVATLHLLYGRRRILTFPPGEGQDELYALATRALDGKGKQRRRAQAEPSGPARPAMSGHSPWGIFLWALAKFGCAVAGGVFVALARDGGSALEQAFLAVTGCALALPIGLFPPSGAAAVLRARVSASGLTYQSLIYGTRTIPWERLAMARHTIVGRLGRLRLVFLELYDRDGGRLVMPYPRNEEFLSALNARLGSTLRPLIAPTARPRRR